MMRQTLILAWMLIGLGTTSVLANEPMPGQGAVGLRSLAAPAPPLKAIPPTTPLVTRLPEVATATPTQWLEPAPMPMAPNAPTTVEPLPPVARPAPAAEIATVPQMPVPIPPAPLPQGSPLPSAPSTLPPPVAPAAPQDEYMTLDQLRAEMRKLAWTKGEFKIVPYGVIWASSSYETSRTVSGDAPFYVYSADAQGEDSFHVDAKSTRLGFDLIGPRIWAFGCAETAAKVEIDFQGSFVTENKGTVLLRHAYVEAKTENTRLLAGQTWDVISPLFPFTLMYPVGWGAGNIGYRHAQLRGERIIPVNDGLLFTLQGSLNHDLDNPSDYAGTPGVRGDHAGWPVLMGRIGTTLGPRGQGCLPITVGVSGHIGEQDYDFPAPNPVDDAVVKTWSVNADFRFPITERFGFQGEFFAGQNLATYLGGILQGINPATREGIRSIGGWGEVWYFWRPNLHSHVGYCVDDPRNEDITTGRTYNEMIFANIAWDVTPKLLVGLETSVWETRYKTQSPGEATRVEFVVKYGF